ncbi:hypothetical protein Ocin01_16380 [Orchesella cincta]|uniref:Uncharacterized protein n=1 Tax=Orchesella cincta TaxID=48709 RepID=A0A1D2MBG1_ORCCI|nr:hypothetical protein Ocin01_16380 [Orchesella cincta]
MVFIAVRNKFTALTMLSSQMSAQETSSMQKLEDFNGAGDAAVKQTKSTKKRTKKKRKAQSVSEIFGSDMGPDTEIVPNGNIDVGGGSASGQLSQQNVSESISTVTLFGRTEVQSPSPPPTTSSRSGSLQRGESYEATTLNSYAAAVSGRKGSGDSLGVGPPSVLCVESTTAFPSIMTNPPLKKSNSTNSLLAIISDQRKEFKDVGVQVSSDIPLSVAESTGKVNDAKLVCRATMTTPKMGSKTKANLAKLCGCDDLLFAPSVVPPVEFHGECFTFENTIATQFAQMGISFFEEEEMSCKD